MVVNGQGFVKHSFSLEIQTQMIEQGLDGGILDRAFHKPLKGHIQHTLALKRQPQRLV